MEEKTLFSIIPDEMYNKFAYYGFYYTDRTYINVYRWMWTDLKVHPDMQSPIGSNTTLISFWIPSTGKRKNTTAEGFDNAIIRAVEFLYEIIDEIKFKN